MTRLNSKTMMAQPFPKNKFMMQWFANLSLNRKQLLALIACEIMSVGLLVIASRITINKFSQTQLLNQAESEVAVTEINYNIKINQMAFGFRGQSDNTTIVRAASVYAEDQTLTPDLQNQVKQILQNEIKVRQIEYATLVGRDSRIIVNANRDRSGEIFNPNNLVSQIFNNPEPIKVSEIVSWAELAKEAPPLPKGFANQDALIRYTVIPIRDPVTKAVIAALISGDIVNGKLPIVEGTLKAFKGGYSALYLRKHTGEFTLATALDQGNATDLKQAQTNVTLPNSSLLTAAVAAQGQPVSGRMNVGSQTYTLAAKTLPNFTGEPVAILVRGTPETVLNQLLVESLLEEMAVLLLVLLMIWFWAIVLRRSIVKPMEQLQQVTKEFSKGNRELRAEVSTKDEIGQVAANFNDMADSVIMTEQFLTEQTQRKERYSYQAELYADVASHRIYQFQDLGPMFDRAAQGARQILNVERVVVYIFNSNWSGYVAAESVLTGWPIALENKIEDACISHELIEAYKNGRVVPTNNVFEAGFHPDHLKLMERLEVKANLVTPIMKSNQLFGLLIAHHCQSPHNWQQYEISFFTQLSNQIGLALDRMSLLEQKEAETDRLRLLKEITIRITRSPNIKDILNTAVEETRIAMKTDRVVVYGLHEKYEKTIIAESVADGWPSALGAEIDDPCFKQQYGERYKTGRIKATENIYNAGMSKCYLQQLEQFAVKANLVAPIIQGDQLLGLLIAHQCSGPRAWQQPEIDFFTQLASQVGYALDIASLLEQQKIGREKLQKRALELLMEVDPVSRGDLTIRASVTEDDIGTVADSYNATIASLSKIVTQVQDAATQVTATTSSNEVSVSELSQEALRQAQEITVALSQIQEMSHSIRAVAANASQAEAAVKQASQTVEAGDAAMNRTVEGILAIRETVASTTKKVKRLGESSQKISKVVNLIGSFANQTNLLALNAAIEAANAGEQGRGFAVVASQVRSLARQSAEATAEIESLVMDIQTETNEVVTAMEAGTLQVITGTKLVDETRLNLNKITAVSTQINTLVEAIASAAVAQAQTSESVTQTMTDMAAIAGKNSNSATLVSASFKELLAVATELQASVGKFKVS